MLLDTNQRYVPAPSHPQHHKTTLSGRYSRTCCSCLMAVPSEWGLTMRIFKWKGSYTRNCSRGCLRGEQPQVADGRILFVLVFGVISFVMSTCSRHRSCLSSIHPPLHPCEQTPDVSGLVPQSHPRETWERPGVSVMPFALLI